MKFDNLLHYIQELPYFDLPLIVQISGESKRQLTVQLHQWVKKGKLIRLRRGMYTLEKMYRQGLIPLLPLANAIYKPSYLSETWALGYYGMIPEKVVTVTSVTTRVTRTFTNSLGVFSYSSLKKDFFWGFIAKDMNGGQVWIAEPEKALLDYWHLHPGLWTRARLNEMRFQELEQLNMKTLSDYSQKWGSKRLIETVKIFQELVDEELDYKKI